MVTATQSLNSLGYTCQLLQRTPAQIRRACVAASIAPTVVLDGVDHFDDAAIDRIRQAIGDRQPQTGD